MEQVSLGEELKQEAEHPVQKTGKSLIYLPTDTSFVGC